MAIVTHDLIGDLVERLASLEDERDEDRRRLRLLEAEREERLREERQRAALWKRRQRKIIMAVVGFAMTALSSVAGSAASCVAQREAAAEMRSETKTKIEFLMRDVAELRVALDTYRRSP